MKMPLKNRGQSTMEYAIVGTVIVIAILAVLVSIRGHIENSLDHVANEMEEAVEQIDF